MASLSFSFLVLVSLSLLSLLNSSSSKKIIAVVSENHSFEFEQLAQKWNSKYVGSYESFPSIHIFETSNETTNVDLLERNFPEGEILHVELDEALPFSAIPPREPEESDGWTPTDPSAWYQWHLYNTRADEAWNLGFSGKGVIVSILDSGSNRHSSDLGNLDISQSWNYVTEKNDPTPPQTLCQDNGDDCSHGTTCSNLAVGQSNDFCGVGIAPGSTLQGFLVLAPRGYHGEVTRSDWIDAQSYPTDVSSNSYGGVACSQTKFGVDCSLLGLSHVDKHVAQEMTESGRNGKGTVFLYASGNDGDIFEDTNIQGVLTLRQNMAIGASTINYHRTAWSCPGAGLMCLAPGNSLFGSTVKITKSGQKEKCGDIGSGTSWATPITAGAVSILLEANPDLSWRDVQHIIARSSYRHFSDEWVKNAAGREFSYDAGFGNLDIYAALRLARNWTSFPQERSSVGQNTTKVTVDKTADYVVNIPDDLVVESVNLQLNIETQARGGLIIELISPSGTIHKIFQTRPDSGANYNDWPALARGFWDERSKGKWIIRVTKSHKYVSAGKTNIKDITVTVYGTKPNEYPNAPELSPAVPAPHLKAESVSRGAVTVLFKQTDDIDVNHNELQIREINSEWKYQGSTVSDTIEVKNLKSGAVYMFRGRSELGSKWSEWSQVLTVQPK